MLRPTLHVARTVGAVLMLLIAFDHLIMLREGFHLGAYIGVLMIVAMGLALSGAAALALEGATAAWWFVFGQSAVSTVGFLVTRRTGVPVAPADVTPALWRGPEAQTLLYAAGVATVLSGWVLLGRMRRPRAHRPADLEHEDLEHEDLDRRPMDSA